MIRLSDTLQYIGNFNDVVNATSAQSFATSLLHILKKEIDNMLASSTHKSSEHPYQGGLSTQDAIDIPGATQLVVMFDSRCDVDGGGSLSFYADSAYNQQLCRLTGGAQQFSPLNISSDRVYMQFHSKDDNMGFHWGYDFTVYGMPSCLRAVFAVLPKLCMDTTVRSAVVHEMIALSTSALPSPVREMLLEGMSWLCVSCLSSDVILSIGEDSFH